MSIKPPAADPEEERVVTDVEVAVERDGDQGQDGGAEAPAHDVGVADAVGRVGHRVGAGGQVQQPEGHPVGRDEQVGQGQVADVQVVQGAQRGLGQQRADDEHVAEDSADAGQPAHGQHRQARDLAHRVAPEGVAGVHRQVPVAPEGVRVAGVHRQVRVAPEEVAGVHRQVRVAPEEVAGVHRQVRRVLSWGSAVPLSHVIESSLLLN